MIHCICGSDRIEEAQNRPGVLVDPKGKNRQATVPTVTCASCGLIRHTDLPFSTEEEYAAHYREQYPPVGTPYSAKNYEGDGKLARLRCDEYGIREGERILDVGCGSGAFVDECRARGGEAFGCEIAQYAYRPQDAGDWIYRQRLEEIHFPTDHFDRVTAHDVIEHVLDPLGFVRDLHRITRQEGQAILEIPDFFGEDGERHWKKNEHLWYFTPESFERLMKEAGFIVSEIERPTESKITFYLRKPYSHRPKILLPPGIGDSYWSIVKMQSFLRREKLGIPDIYIASPKDKEFDGHKRAFPFVEMFPFLASSGVTVSAQDPQSRKIWLEAYSQEGRTIFKNALGMDYFIAYNGHLRVGKELEKIDPDLACNWSPPMFVSLEQERYRREAIERYGRYLVFYFVFQGTYCHWTKEFPLPSVIGFIQKAVKKTGCTPVFAGAKWDGKDASLNQVKAAIPRHVNLVGKTDAQQLFGLLRGAQGVVGYPSGLTIMSAVLRQKTLIIWNDYYNRDFAWFCVPPEVRKQTYFAGNTKGLRADELAEQVSGIVGPAKMPSERRIDSAPSAPLPAMKPEIAVVCILNRGSSFNWDHVRSLQDGVRRNTTLSHRFYCLTDFDPPEGVKALPLNGYQWSPKIELFGEGLFQEPRVLYLDLDTLILANIDNLLTLDQDFLALRPWKTHLEHKLCLSGMMSWVNDRSFSFLNREFNVGEIGRYPQGDREYISKSLAHHGKEMVFFQNVIRGMYSWRQCKSSIPKDARIICYHGHPMEET